MPVAPTYPGVYIEEVPSGVRPITGVATSIGAFIGFFSRGPIGEAIRVFNREDFNREFGGLREDSVATYCIEQFFLNGGSEAWVVRAASGNPEASAVVVQNDTPTDMLRIDARSEGVWGDNIRVDVDYGTASPGGTFNLTAEEVVDGEVVATESFLGLSMVEGTPTYALAVVNDGSRLVRLDRLAVANDPPVQTGTVSERIHAVDNPLSGKDLSLPIDVTANGATVNNVTLSVPLPATMPALAAALQQAVRQADPAVNIEASVIGTSAEGAYLRLRAVSDDPASVVEVAGALAVELGFVQNVQRYALGGGTVGGTFQQGADGGAAQTGNDGGLPGAADLVASLPAFDPVDLINILCIPGTDGLAANDAFSVASEAESYALGRRAFYILDPPNPVGAPLNEISEIEGWLDENATLRHTNAALYFPRPQVPDPLKQFRPRAIPASGTIAGLYARIDGERGVWKAPAGLEASLRGVRDLELKMSDQENGVLNPLAINALRTFRNVGNVCWGSRTLVGSNQASSEWKYVPVRRLALFLEESLFRGTQFAVFEPNDEPLWAQIRLNVGAFMQGLFLQGAFQGSTPRQAYLVKCDSETTSQDDINKGIVNVIVGFAPLKPAEFIIIKIQQLAGQSQA